MSKCPLCEIEDPTAFDTLCARCREKQRRGELRAVALALVFFIGSPVLAWLAVG